METTHSQLDMMLEQYENREIERHDTFFEERRASSFTEKVDASKG